MIGALEWRYFFKHCAPKLQEACDFDSLFHAALTTVLGLETEIRMLKSLIFSHWLGFDG
ncbi:hypothetical protein HanXRQr2_Chr11g0480761 [Helianthus annuus]|uniref:Uncharacterized protein n=1 Tax=Helianthus annuus TaxID=4232 RepID=A0A9K3MZA0_HELAN|nr:hypothetical protein HanXRQr2_Chr11g0480761 [Helianthus annuus]